MKAIIEITRLILIILIPIIISSCTAPVKISAFPGSRADDIDLEFCEGRLFIDVLGTFPANKNYEELGYMNANQTSILINEEKIIESAKQQACQWGANAIIITAIEVQNHQKWNPLIGIHSTETKQFHITAIKYIE